MFFKMIFQGQTKQELSLQVTESTKQKDAPRNDTWRGLSLRVTERERGNLKNLRITHKLNT